MTDIASLTREEAAQRGGLISVQRYDVHVDLRGLFEGDLWAATSTVSFTCHEPGASTFVDCVGTVSSVTLNGQALDPDTAERGRICGRRTSWWSRTPSPTPTAGPRS